MMGGPSHDDDDAHTTLWTQPWHWMTPRLRLKSAVGAAHSAIASEAMRLASRVLTLRSRSALERLTGITSFDSSITSDDSNGSSPSSSHSQPSPSSSLSAQIDYSGITDALHKYHEYLLGNQGGMSRMSRSQALAALASSGKAVVFRVVRSNMVNGVLDTMSPVGYENILAPMQTQYIEENNIAQDDGGLTRDLFTEFFAQVTRRDVGLFEPFGDEDDQVLVPSIQSFDPNPSFRHKHRQLSSVGKMTIRAILEGHTVPFRLHPLALQVLLGPDPLPRRTAPATTQSLKMGNTPLFRLCFYVKGIDFSVIDVNSVSQSVLLSMGDTSLEDMGLTFADVSLDALDTLSPVVAHALFPSLPQSGFLTQPTPDTYSSHSRRLPSLATCTPPPSWFRSHRTGDQDISNYHASPALDWAPLSWIECVGPSVVASAAAATPVTSANAAMYIALCIIDDVIISRYNELLALRAGFQLVTPILPLLNLMGAEAVQQALCGKPRLIPEEVITLFTFGQDWRGSSTPDHFRRIVLEDLQPKELGQLIRLCTSLSNVPASGMRRNITVNRCSNTNALPVGHTCVGALDLPDYRDYRLLLKKLRLSLEHVDTTGFGYV